MASVMGFRPIGGKILVLPLEKKYTGLLTLPQNAKKAEGQARYGKVIATGPGMLMKTGARWPMPAAPGDEIVFLDVAGHTVKLDDPEGVEREYLIIRDDVVIGGVES